MALLSIREHETLHVGSFDPDRPSVTEAMAEQLTNLRARYGVDVFKYTSRTTIKAQQHVGAVQLGTHTVEVLPKVEGETPNVRRNVVAMLAATLDLEIREGELATVASQNYGILEILIRLFCDKLFHQAHRGLVKRYERQEDNLRVLRGKLGVMEQTRLNSAHPERLYCRFDEFQEDTPLNQVLKAAVRLLLRVSRNVTNQKRLGELCLVFQDVSDCQRGFLPWGRVEFDRLSLRFQTCYRMAEQFLKQMPPDVSAGRLQSYSLFFDMNNLFEEYIGRIAVHVLSTKDFRIRLQAPRRYLAREVDGKRDRFLMKPDVVAMHGDNVAWILDTKWKMLSAEEAREGVSQGDLYQMYAYANRYDCRDVVLLYPYHVELGARAGVRSSYALYPWDGEAGSTSSRRVRTASVDLAELKSVPSQLKAILGDSASVVSRDARRC